MKTERSLAFPLADTDRFVGARGSDGLVHVVFVSPWDEWYTVLFGGVRHVVGECHHAISLEEAVATEEPPSCLACLVAT